MGCLVHAFLFWIFAHKFCVIRIKAVSKMLEKCMMSKLSAELNKRKGKIIYLLAVEALLLCLIIYYLFVDINYINVVRVIVTIILAMIPMAMELIFRMHIFWPLYCFVVIYACEHTMGSCFNLYLFIPWWDIMMHCTEGILFTLFGYYYLSKDYEINTQTRIKNLVFAVSLSVFIGVLWEITEYGVDSFTLNDMQKDVFITSMKSYLLEGNNGQIGTINDIKTVTVDGQVLPGYIDIGLIDTMKDLITALIGSVIFCVYALIDRDRHPILKFENKNNTAIQSESSGKSPE